MVNSVLDWVDALLEYIFGVKTGQVVSARSFSNVPENLCVESTQCSVDVEELNCKSTTIDSSCLGNQTVDIPGLVNL